MFYLLLENIKKIEGKPTSVPIEPNHKMSYEEENDEVDKINIKNALQQNT